MPCYVIIQPGSLKGVPTGIPERIMVSGMAVGSPSPSQVDVRLEFRSLDGTDVDHVTPTISVTVNSETGIWQAEFNRQDHWPNRTWRCGMVNPIDVYANLPGYTASADCIPSAQEQFSPLECVRPLDCLDNGAIEYSVTDNQTGEDVTARVDGPGCFQPFHSYRVTLEEPTGYMDNIRWEVEETPYTDSVDFVDVLMLAQGDRRVDVFIDLEDPCPPIHKRITLDNCAQPTQEKPGCTDPNATNYDPEATVDDGSCVYEGERRGCTDSNAINYDPLATVDDGSCIYEDGKKDCGGLLWAAVVALALSLLLLIFAWCFSAITGYLLALSAVLFVLYLFLLGLYKWRVRIGVCKKKKCYIAEVHVQVLAPIGIILGFMALLCIYGAPWCSCWSPYGLAAFSAVLGFWADRLRRCRKKQVESQS